MTAAAHCERCGVPCRVNPRRNEDARLLQHAREPKGICANCGVAQWLQFVEPICELIKRSGGPEMLRMEHIRSQFEAIMRAGNADAQPDEIDWEHVIANWDLPFSEDKPRRRKRP